MKKLSERHGLHGLYAGLFLLMFLLSSMTPMLADDFSYCFSWADDSRIASLGQIVESMKVHREVTNGRVLVHGLVQLLLIFPKTLFNILNGLNAVLLAALFSRYLNRDRPRQSAVLLLLGGILLWNFTPVFGQVFLWLDGAVNYSWSLSLCLLFLWPYSRQWLKAGSRAPALWLWPLFLLLAFVFGTCSESFAPASLAAAGVLTLLIWRREKRFPLFLAAGLAVACLGYLFLMTAPAVAGRSDMASLSAIAGNVKEVLLRCKELLLPLYMIYGLTLALSGDVSREKRLLSLLLAASGLLSLAAYVFAAYFAHRHCLYAVAMTVLGELILLDGQLERGKTVPTKLLAAAMSVLFVFQFALGCLDIAVIYSHSRQREAAIAQAKAAGETEIALECYVASTKYSAPYLLDDLNPDPESWPNISVAFYYGMDAVSGYYPGEK